MAGVFCFSLRQGLEPFDHAKRFQKNLASDTSEIRLCEGTRAKENLRGAVFTRDHFV